MKALIIESLDLYQKVMLNRPKALNALNSSIFEALFHFLNTADQKRGLILLGNGEKAFSAGADVKELKEMTLSDLKTYQKLANQTIDALEHYPMPTIALLHGYTLGGGLELALACDFLIAEETALFGMPETKIGLIPGFKGIERLQRRIGISRTKELFFSGIIITSQEALSYKLIDMVVKKEFIEPFALDTLKTMLHNPESISLAKQSFFNQDTSKLFQKAFKSWIKS